MSATAAINHEALHSAMLLKRKDVLPLGFRPPLISMSWADPPGLMLRAIADRFWTTPFTREGPSPPKVAMPRRTIIVPIG